MSRFRPSLALAAGLVLLVGLASRPATAAVVYMGPNEANKTLRQAFAAMKGGDTLVIRDGTYTGVNNVITLGQSGVTDNMPPNGTAEAYTIIRAEHEGLVTFDGQHTIMVFGVRSSSTPADEFAYIEFHGLKWIRPVESLGNMSGAVNLARADAHHIKWFRCGAAVIELDAAYRSYGVSQWAIESGHHLLFEECYSWGNGRYGWKIQDRYSNVATGDEATLGARQIICRRCVARNDRSMSNMPVANFMAYDAASVEFQNCIAIDTDPAYFNFDSGPFANFMNRYHLGSEGYGWSADNHWRGDLVLNTNNDYTQFLNDSGVWTARNPSQQMMPFMIVNQVAELPNSVQNCVMWDVPSGITWSASEDRYAPGLTVTNITVGLPKQYGDQETVIYPYGVFCASASLYGKFTEQTTVKNSLGISADDLLARGGYGPRVLFDNGKSDFSAFWTPSKNVTDGTVVTIGTHDYTEMHSPSDAINPYTGTPGNGIPALKYITRIEPGSNLYGTGENGSNRGATIVKRYGVSGTVWGEPGYNTLTDEDLWPFPAEDQIRDAFRSYSYSGGPDGKRGFCADGQTLTNYIWGYLDSAVPPLGLVATPGSGSVTLNWATPADIALPTITGFNIYRVDGGQRLLMGTVDGNATYTATVTGLDSSGSYAFAMTTVDSVKGESGLSEIATLGTPDLSTFEGAASATTSTPTTPIINWPTPAPIVQGTALSAAQLNATANVPGTFVYTPASGTVLSAGTYLLSAVFTPADPTLFASASAAVSPTLADATLFAEETPSVTHGPMVTALDATETGSVGQAPTGAAIYATASVSLVVIPPPRTTPAITWAAPAAITAGTALSSAQLNATASVPGAFTYSPAAGTVLAAGTSTLTASFTPTNTTLYNSATASVKLTVNAVLRTTPTITWAAPAAITAGTALSSAQLNAAASVPGAFTYSPAAGTVLAAGTSTLTASFTPANTTLYNSATASVKLTVNAVVYQLTVTRPTGGTVRSAGIRCGTAGTICQVTMSATMSLGLEATPDSGYAFTSWSGDCAGTSASYTLLLNGQKSCSATFTATATSTSASASSSDTLTYGAPYRLTVDQPSGGTVRGAGINCGTKGKSCVVYMPGPMSLGLQATPDTGYGFSGWSGNCAGTSTNTTLALEGTRRCGATFAAVSSSGSASSSSTSSVSTTTTSNTSLPTGPPYTLTLARPSGGTIRSAGTNCGTSANTCSVTMPAAMWLGLEATPDRGYTFAGWTGHCSGTSRSYALVLNGPRTCGAAFTVTTGSHP